MTSIAAMRRRITLHATTTGAWPGVRTMTPALPFTTIGSALGAVRWVHWFTCSIRLLNEVTNYISAAHDGAQRCKCVSELVGRTGEAEAQSVRVTEECARDNEHSSHGERTLYALRVGDANERRRTCSRRDEGESVLASRECLEAVEISASVRDGTSEERVRVFQRDPRQRVG